MKVNLEGNIMKKRTVQNNGKTSHKGFQKGNRYGFQPGQRGNPSGRPKKDIAAEIAQRVFEENAEAIYRAMLKALLKGDPEVFAVLADRAFGNPGDCPERDLAAEIARKVIVEYLRYLRGKPKGRRSQ